MGSISLNSAGVIATDPLFANLNLVIGEGDRVGLVAGNGGGKTTLLRCIAGTQELTARRDRPLARPARRLSSSRTCRRASCR